MHFYLRNAKLDDIKQFKQKTGIKSLGMPYILANGSAEVNGQKHRFIVMPRYGSDISKFFVQNGKRLPEGTVYRLAIQMLDVYQFMHGTGYVHADLKAANILLGLGKGGGAQAYLVDFGLASHYTTGSLSRIPRKCTMAPLSTHRGTPIWAWPPGGPTWKSSATTLSCGWVWSCPGRRKNYSTFLRKCKRPRRHLWTTSAAVSRHYFPREYQLPLEIS